MAHYFYLLCINLCLNLASSAPEKTIPGSRVHDGKLSDKEHYDKDGNHNPEYDHEAFLGKEKKSFDQLTPVESKERLGTQAANEAEQLTASRLMMFIKGCSIKLPNVHMVPLKQKIVDKIDKDGDGKITMQELKDWIQFSKTQHNLDVVKERWKDMKQREEKLVSRSDYDGDKTMDPKGLLSWERYRRFSFGADPENHEDSERLLKQMKIDERRWKAADLDHDDKLSDEEFGPFYQPWEYDYMQGIVAQENLEDLDKDRDGRLSPQEFLDGIYKKSESEMTEDELKRKEADKDYFHSERDGNKDGYLDTDEMKEWLFPTSYDHLAAEASHLVYHADANKDDELTKVEILDKHDLFVGSKATSYGVDLTRHDEF